MPGQSLGGVRLGWTLTQVVGVWGRAYARCRGCARETVYFTRYAFRPQGAAVELTGGRVTAAFTMWAPPGWRTSAGLRMGDPVARIATLYGRPQRTRCRGADAYRLRDGRAQSVVYVVDERVWGLALLARGHPVCL